MCHWCEWCQVLVQRTKIQMHVHLRMGYCQILFKVKGKLRDKMHCLLSSSGSEIVSPYDAASHHWYIQLQILNNCLVWLKFLCFETFTQPFVNDIIPPLLVPKQGKTVHAVLTWTRLYILLSFIEIIKAWPLYICALWTRGHAYLLT